MQKLFLLVALVLLASCGNKNKDMAMNGTTSNSQQKQYKVTKSNEEWKEILTPEEYQILRQAGTERPFTSPLNEETSPGTLICAACRAPLYNNENKFKSGTGWPSYDRAIDGQVERDVDYKIGYARTELKCNTCGSHLGHEFDDGPRETTGKRHCINGVALDFVAEGEELPALRQ
ncbi:peptide-methionine (R)-S-oxide reductase MsrB [Nonlabens xiamenensis]|uniref:peptide-methionine (R)-S-oxide reductase MsrB n=1 Tax=Nonlabens xiamenensis TaxID=2341043 RepID=UPI000F60F121|nr:peptide-methionine (R)-S-oxide reductase MsrB [Nonlabens xiamenensis]